MSENVQVIKKNGEPEYALVCYEDYLHLVEAAEMLAEKNAVSAPYLSQIETGKRVDSAEALQKIARVLDVSLDDLFPGS